MNRHIILAGFLIACFMLTRPPDAAAHGDCPDPPPPTESAASSQAATVPSTQSTANMDSYTPGSSDPLSSPSLISQTNAMGETEREARDARAKVIMETFNMGVKIAEALAQQFQTPHSDNLEHWGHSQVTDTIYVQSGSSETLRDITPPAQKEPTGPVEFLGDGIVGNAPLDNFEKARTYLREERSGRTTTKNTSVPIDNAATGSRGDIIKMQETSKAEASPKPKVVIPENLNEFTKYMDSVSPIDRTKPPPQKYQQGQTQTGGPIQADHSIPKSNWTTQQKGQPSTGGNKSELDFTVH